VREGGVVEISKDDYQPVGGVKGQIEAHVRDAIRTLVTEKRIPKDRIESEADCWREALQILSKTQVDGTVTTEFVPRAKLEEEVAKVGCAIPFDDTVAQFLEGVRIVRPVSVYNAKDSEEINCFVLGHDVIGLALRSWQPRLVGVPFLSSIRRTSRGVGATSIVVPIIYAIGYRVFFGDWPDRSSPVIVLGSIYGVAFLALGTKLGVRAFAQYIAAIYAASAGIFDLLGLEKAARNFRRMSDRYKRGMPIDDL
jgi:hypothetical protein